ncbi:hypothetical protein PSTT_07287 [Puccinia striiformis]|uniref:RRM domain-containing protein n=1 Tax=Puccinia striiformis TaxID=27350 RepID=A0A2S4VGW6_9BASI|nr:hypothetical protein PSTT_07287 [Puccinia striiformis]
MASARGRSASPKPLRTENQAPKSEPQDDAVPNGIKKAKASPRSRSASGSRRSSRGASPKIRHSDSRSMSLSRSSSENRSRSRSYSRSRSRSPRRNRARSTLARLLVLVPDRVQDHILHTHQEVYGTIKEVDLPIVRQIGSHRGTAIVTFDTGKAAQKAVSHMDRGQLDRSLISVQIYRPPSPPRGPAAQGRVHRVEHLEAEAAALLDEALPIADLLPVAPIDHKLRLLTVANDLDLEVLAVAHDVASGGPVHNTVPEALVEIALILGVAPRATLDLVVRDPEVLANRFCMIIGGNALGEKKKKNRNDVTNICKSVSLLYLVLCFWTTYYFGGACPVC